MEYTEKHAAHKFGLTGAEGFQRKGEMLPKKKKRRKELIDFHDQKEK